MIMVKTPICILTADNKPLNDLILQRIKSVTVTDNRANEADQLDIVLDDSDGVLDLPRRGVKINCQLGFEGEGLHDKGDFIVDETECQALPIPSRLKLPVPTLRAILKKQSQNHFTENPLVKLLQRLHKIII